MFRFLPESSARACEPIQTTRRRHSTVPLGPETFVGDLTRHWRVWLISVVAPRPAAVRKHPAKYLAGDFWRDRQKSNIQTPENNQNSIIMRGRDVAFGLPPCAVSVRSPLAGFSHATLRQSGRYKGRSVRRRWEPSARQRRCHGPNRRCRKRWI